VDSKLGRHFVQQRADFLLKSTLQHGSAGAVNLTPLARIQCVDVVEFRPMMMAGCIDFRDTGFVAYIQHDESFTWDIREADETPRLNNRQRFTLAHEIAHTFFFSKETGRVQPSGRSPRGNALERLCNLGAALILLPQMPISAYARKESFSPLSLVNVAQSYGVSLEVLIRRLNGFGVYGDPNRAILLLNRREEAVTVKAVYGDALIFRQAGFPLPKPYTLISAMTQDFREAIAGKETKKIIQTGRRSLEIVKTPHPTRPATLLVEISIIYP
jgi:hypothetical protein